MGGSLYHSFRNCRDISLPSKGQSSLSASQICTPASLSAVNLGKGKEWLGCRYVLATSPPLPKILLPFGSTSTPECLCTQCFCGGGTELLETFLWLSMSPLCRSVPWDGLMRTIWTLCTSLGGIKEPKEMINLALCLHRWKISAKSCHLSLSVCSGLRVTGIWAA